MFSSVWQSFLVISARARYWPLQPADCFRTRRHPHAARASQGAALGCAGGRARAGATCATVTASRRARWRAPCVGTSSTSADSRPQAALAPPAGRRLPLPAPAPPKKATMDLTAPLWDSFRAGRYDFCGEAEGMPRGRTKVCESTTCDSHTSVPQRRNRRDEVSAARDRTRGSVP